MPDFTSQFVHEFHCWASLAESMILEGQTERPVQQLQFHVLVCEGLVPFSNADLDGLDREETAYMMALAIAGPARLGFRIRDCGRNNWGFGFRNGRVVPLVLDGNSWTQLDSTDEAFNRFPTKKLIGSFWHLPAEVHADAATDIEAIVYHPSDGPPLDSELIFSSLLRRLAGLNAPQTWNPFR